MCVITMSIVFNYFNSLSVLIVNLICPLHLLASVHKDMHMLHVKTCGN